MENKDFEPTKMSVAAREILEALWDLEDLHRELIKRAEFLCQALGDTSA